MERYEEEWEGRKGPLSKLEWLQEPTGTRPRRHRLTRPNMQDEKQNLLSRGRNVPMTGFSTGSILLLSIQWPELVKDIISNIEIVDTFY